MAVFRRPRHDGLMNGNAQARKELLRLLVAEIVVEGRNTIRPYFKIPTLTSPVGFQPVVREMEVCRPDLTQCEPPLLVEGPTLHL
jgi:hypothetical protein